MSIQIIFKTHNFEFSAKVRFNDRISNFDQNPKDVCDVLIRKYTYIYRNKLVIIKRKKKVKLEYNYFKNSIKIQNINLSRSPRVIVYSDDGLSRVF